MNILEERSLSWPPGMNRKELEESAKIYPLLSISEMRDLHKSILDLDKKYDLSKIHSKEWNDGIDKYRKELAELYTKYGLPTDEAPIVYYVSDDDPLLETRINKVQI